MNAMIAVLEPGQASRYHREANQEDFLVLAGECLLLIEGEELVLDLRPHWIALVMPGLVTALVVIGYLVVLGYAPDDGAARSAIVWGGLVLGLAVLVWYPLRAFIAWATSNFAVTTDHHPPRGVHREALDGDRSRRSTTSGSGSRCWSAWSGPAIWSSSRPASTDATCSRTSEPGASSGRSSAGRAEQAADVPGRRRGPSPSAPSVTTGSSASPSSGTAVLTEAEFQNQKKKILGR
jgi:hypothetical protein